jgi:hypothetical protein
VSEKLGDRALEIADIEEMTRLKSRACGPCCHVSSLLGGMSQEMCIISKEAFLQPDYIDLWKIRLTFPLPPDLLEMAVPKL